MKLMPEREREDKTVIGEYAMILLLLFPATPFMLQYETKHAQVSGKTSGVRYSSRLPVIETRIADFES